MNAIDTFPPALEVPAVLPQFRPETAARLIHWALRQPGSLPWLLRRTAELWAAHPVPPPAMTADARHAQIDATASVELLRWRVAAPGFKEALAHLHDQAQRRRDYE
jgi:hypothetical protein